MKETQVILPRNLVSIFANNCQVYHLQDIFCIRFIMIEPAVDSITDSRVVAEICVSPHEFKKIIKAFKNNLEMYEDTYGEIKDKPIKLDFKR